LSDIPVESTITKSEDGAIVPYLDSKIGARKTIGTSILPIEHLRQPRAVIIETEAAQSLSGLLRSALSAIGPAMVKSNYGYGGKAMTYIEDEASIREKLEEVAEYLQYDAIVVEEYIGMPGELIPVAYNGFVASNSTVTTKSVGRQLIETGKYFSGSRLGIGALPAGCCTAARAAGIAIGTAIASLRFRGWFNVDFLYRPRSHEIFPIEINPRRSGSATIAEMCSQVFGPTYESQVSAIAVEKVPIARHINDYQMLRDALESVSLFGSVDRDLKLVPYIVSSITDNATAGIAVLGPDPSTVRDVFAAATEILSPKG
jgi:biotin carboxylase